MKKYQRIIGIDPGVTTGIAIYDTQTRGFALITSVSIHAALHMVHNEFENWGSDVLVRVEDARKRTWFGNTGKERLKGAGSVERDCRIWEDYLKEMGVPFEMVHPKNNRTKLPADTFKKITGWQERTNEHSRDAAGLLLGY